jgi:molecular chaperone GrpE (heat shock protein)
MLRDEMVKMRYILEEIRDGKIRPHAEEHHGCISEEQFEELKSIVHTKPQENIETKFDELLTTMAKIRNDILKLSMTIRKDLNNMRKADLVESIEGYAIDIANLLIDNGVTMSEMIDEDYNPSIHVISSVVETEDPTLQGKIAESTGDYYEKDGRVILRNGVKVYRYVKKEKSTKKKKDNNESEAMT